MFYNYTLTLITLIFVKFRDIKMCLSCEALYKGHVKTGSHNRRRVCHEIHLDKILRILRNHSYWGELL